MRKSLPMLATALLLATTPAYLSATPSCEELLAPMATMMQSMREGATPSADEHQRWRIWTAQCRDRRWQDQLAQTLPSRPAPMVRDTPLYSPGEDPPTLTWQDYARAALQGIEQGASAPMTICRTHYASRKGRVAYYTSCNTIGGY